MEEETGKLISGFNLTLERRWFIQFFVSILICITNGACFCFGIFSPYMKKGAFKYNQSQINVISTFGVVLSYFSLPTGFLFDKKGPKVTLIVGALMNALGWLGMALIFMDIDHPWMSTKVLPVCIFYGISQLSASFFETGSVMTNLDAFSCYQGRVIIIQKTFMGLGSSIIVQIYVSYFETNFDSIGPFFIFLLIYSFTVGVLGAFFVRLPNNRTRCLGLNVATQEQILKGGEPTLFDRPFNVGTAILMVCVVYVLCVTLLENYLAALTETDRQIIGICTIFLCLSFFLMVIVCPSYSVNVGGFKGNRAYSAELSEPSHDSQEGPCDTLFDPENKQKIGDDEDEEKDEIKIKRKEQEKEVYEYTNNNNNSDNNNNNNNKVQTPTKGEEIPTRREVHDLLPSPLDTVVEGLCHPHLSTSQCLIEAENNNNNNNNNNNKEDISTTIVTGLPTRKSSRHIQHGKVWDEEDTAIVTSTSSSSKEIVLNERSLWKNMYHLDLWLLWFICFASWSSATVISTNSSQIYSSLDFNSYSPTINTVYVSIYGVASAVGRVIIGVAHPIMLKKKIPISSFTISAPVINIIGLPLFLCMSQALYVPFFLIGLATGVAWGSVILIIKSLFASNNCGKHYSFLYTAGILSPIVFNVGMFGPIYDHYSKMQGLYDLRQCKGRQCVWIQFLAVALVNVLAIPCAILFMIRTTRKRGIR